MIRTHRTIATCLLSLVGLTGCLSTIGAPPHPPSRTFGSLWQQPDRVADFRSRWQQADGALDDLDGYLARTGRNMIRVHRQQGPPVVLHQVQMSNDTLYSAHLDEGIPLADVVAVDVPLHPPPYACISFSRCCS